MCIPSDHIVQGLDSMRKQTPWAAVFAELGQDDWCETYATAKDQLVSSLAFLSGKGRIPGPTVKRIQRCFAIG